LSEHASEQAESYGENNKDLGHVRRQFTESKRKEEEEMELVVHSLQGKKASKQSKG
jgi:hypothetical protein